jgi:hypothetical protein
MEEVAKWAEGRADWRWAVLEYTKLLELLPEADRRSAWKYICPRASAYIKLGQLEELKKEPVRAAYYYRLMVRDDCKDQVARRTLTRLKSCALQAFRVRGVAAADSNAVLKVIHPDWEPSSATDKEPKELRSCGRLCRFEEDAAVRRTSAGAFYVFPGLLPPKGSRCGGTTPRDTANFLVDDFSWTAAVSSNCSDNTGAPCPLSCGEPVEQTDSGWEQRTVALDPNRDDSVLVVDQRNDADGPGAWPQCEAKKLHVTSDGSLSANAVYCTKLPIADSQAYKSITPPPPAVKAAPVTSAPTKVRTHKLHSSVPRAAPLGQWREKSLGLDEGACEQLTESACARGTRYLTPKILPRFEKRGPSGFCQSSNG